ncbi:DUF3352 domain-containing protein [Oscillatoria laete-virens NRMC-F 0139]|nr:DUF3352 domain-containing protein [Oscillatoria laete-virens]MDL5053092.1 DUF3352 domain-containing protein [Oscillatoria laete-virens NRMC-F 0139]
MSPRFKKFLIIFLAVDLLLVLIGLGVYWWFFMRGGKPLDITATLPPDTVIYLEINDAAKLKEDFKKTAYSKIWNDPGVKAFMDPMLAKSDGPVPGKLLDQLGKMPGKTTVPGTPAVDDVSRTLNLLVKSLPDVLRKKAVLAVAELKISPPKATLVLAYDFTGAEAQQKTFEEALKAEFKGFKPQESIKIKGVGVETARSAKGMMAAKALFGSTVVYTFSTDTKILEGIIERHSSGDGAGGLADSPRFKEARAKITGEPSTLFYVNVESFLDLAKPFLAMMPSGQSTLDQIKPYKALMSTTTILPDGLLQEQTYIVMPADERPEYMRNPGVLDSQTLKLTSPSTLVYQAGRSGSMVGMYDFVMKQAYRGDPMGQQTVQNLESMFAARGINLRDDFFAALGDESAFVMDWPSDKMQPVMFLAQQTADAGKLRGTVDKLIAMLQEFGGKELAIQTSANSAGFVTYAIPFSGPLSFLSPTISVSDKHLIVANSLDALELAIARGAGDGTGTLKGTPAFDQAVARVPTGGYALGYIDSKNLFSRVYEMIRTYAMLAGAFIPPDPESGLDLKKIPPTSAIANYLSTSIATDIADEKGIYTTSVSALGNQIYGFFAIVAAGAMIPHLDKIKEMNPLSPSKPPPWSGWRVQGIRPAIQRGWGWSSQ